MYTALYLPMRDEGEPDPSKSGFESPDAAEEYIFSRMCEHCQRSREQSLAAIDAGEDTDLALFPGCYYEWLIVPDTAKDKPLDEVFVAAGLKQIWKA